MNDEMRTAIHGLRNQLDVILMALEVKDLEIVKVAAKKACVMLELVTLKVKEHKLIQEIHKDDDSHVRCPACLQGGDTKGGHGMGN